MVAEHASATESVDQQNRLNGQNCLGLFSEAKRRKPRSIFLCHYYASMQMAVLSFGRRLGHCLAELHHGSVLRINSDPVSRACRNG